MPLNKAAKPSTTILYILPCITGFHNILQLTDEANFNGSLLSVTVYYLDEKALPQEQYQFFILKEAD